MTLQDEPPVGVHVVDALGNPWQRQFEGYWLRTDVDADPESWVKVAGNYGPVIINRCPVFVDAFGNPVDPATAGVDPDEPCTTKRLLALPYVSHPDYDEAWRP